MLDWKGAGQTWDAKGIEYDYCVVSDRDGIYWKRIFKDGYLDDIGPAHTVSEAMGICKKHDNSFRTQI